MNNMVDELVEQCADAYNVCADYMNPQSLSLIEKNHRRKIMEECAHHNLNMIPYLKKYEIKTKTGIE